VLVVGRTLGATSELVQVGVVIVMVGLVIVMVTLVFVLGSGALVRVGVRLSTSGCGFSMLSGRFATGPNPGKPKVWARRARPSSRWTETDASLRVRRAAALRRIRSSCDLMLLVLGERSVSNGEYPST
jgi:hypothetical protein